jgi:tellurite resistance protein TehA-like permease
MLWLISIVGILIALNVYACVSVARSGETSRSKKWSQCLFVWLLPVIGAMVALTVHKPCTTAAALADSGIDDGITMPGQLNNYDEMR